MERRLTLRAERLASLSDTDLASVSGGTVNRSLDCVSVAAPTYELCDRLSITCLTGYYPSVNASCTNAC